MVCYCQLQSTSPLPECEVTWAFNQPDLVNCRLGLGKHSTLCALTMRLTPEQPRGLATLDRLQLSHHCKSGAVALKTTP
jgi:hypothetical protein